MSSTDVVFCIVRFADLINGLCLKERLDQSLIFPNLRFRGAVRVFNSYRDVIIVNDDALISLVSNLRGFSAVLYKDMIVPVKVVYGGGASRKDTNMSIVLARFVRANRSNYIVPTTGVVSGYVNDVVITSYSRKIRYVIRLVLTMFKKGAIVVFVCNARSVRLSRTNDLRLLVISNAFNVFYGVTCVCKPNSIVNKGGELCLVRGIIRTKVQVIYRDASTK